jgi:hypothetical protein
MCQIIGDPKCLDDRVTATLKLTLDHNNYRLKLFNKCSIPRTSALLADKSFFFFNLIYSTLYNIILKRYLTLFAITQDFFYSFFSTAKDNLN